MNQNSPDPFDVLRSLGVANAFEARRVHGGWDTTIWKVEWAGGPSALRLYAHGEYDTSRYELAALQAARIAGVRVPAIQAEGSWSERPTVLLSWCPGSTLIDAIKRRPMDIVRLGAAFGEQQAHIHAIEAPNELRDRSWLSWAGMPDQALAKKLRQLGRGSSLLHKDFHPLNVMVADRHVTCVLDWANACGGDPRADVARTRAILRLAPSPRGVSRFLLAVMRRLLDHAWWRGYCRVAGEPTDMNAFYALAGDAMFRDLAPKLGKPGIPLQQNDVDRLRRWSADWRRTAGIDGGK